jgi:hypothetical protein
VKISVVEEPAVQPNAITGIPKLELSVLKSVPFSSYIYIGMYTDDLFKGKFGVIKGLVVVCGQERVKLVDTVVIKYRLFGLPTNEKEVIPLSEIFKVDISNTL